MGRPCCRINYCNVEKLHKDTGAIIWRAALPFTSDFAMATVIEPLSDGSYVIVIDGGGMYRLSNDGSTIIASTSDGPGELPNKRQLTIKRGYEYGYVGGARAFVDTTDLIYISSPNRIACFDSHFNLIWNKTSLPLPSDPIWIKYYNGLIYAAYEDAFSSGVFTYDATTGSLVNSFGVYDTSGNPIGLVYLSDVGPNGLILNDRYLVPLSGGHAISQKPIPAGGGIPAIGSIWSGNYIYAMGFDGPGDTNLNTSFDKFDPHSNFATLWAGLLGTYPLASAINHFYPFVWQIVPLNDGGFAIAGHEGWQAICTQAPFYGAYGSGINGFVNAWVFNSDGSFRWANRSDDEMSSGTLDPLIPLGPGNPGPPRTPPRQWNGRGDDHDSSHGYNIGGTANGMKWGVAVAHDGHPVFTSGMFRVRPRPPKGFCGTYGSACSGQCAYEARDIAPFGYPGTNTGTVGQFVVWYPVNTVSGVSGTFPSCSTGCTCIPFTPVPYGDVPIDTTAYADYFTFCNQFGYPNAVGEILYVNCS